MPFYATADPHMSSKGSNTIDGDACSRDCTPDLQAVAYAESGRISRLLQHDTGAKCVVVDFFAYSCTNCLRTIPVLRHWHERYHEYGAWNTPCGSLGHAVGCMLEGAWLRAYQGA